MFFPWVGLLEQIRLADIFVYYSDVQYSKGSFTNRVQIKTKNGTKWLTVPLKGFSLGQKINQVEIQDSEDWRKKHLTLLHDSYYDAPYVKDMINVVEDVYAQSFNTIDEISRASMVALVEYFSLGDHTIFLSSDSLAINGESSKRVFAIVNALGGTDYITGHGAKNYLNHSLFEMHDISVSYMDYKLVPYSQLHGQFTPYVSALDLIANMGKRGRTVVCSGTKPWKDFLS